MAAKPTKKTDVAKPWNRRTKPGSYRVGSIPMGKRILIVCEGQTEKLYFESFPVVSMEVKCIDMKGESKTRLVELCRDRVERLRRSGKEYDEIWCVYDMDLDQGEKEKADFDNSIQMAHAKGYRVAYSNDCFELWFYLHYQYTDRCNRREFYYRQLGERWKINYEREGKKKEICAGHFNRLQKPPAHIEKAIERAERLHTRFSHLPYHRQNPVTTVYQLVQVLLENQKR